MDGLIAVIFDQDEELSNPKIVGVSDNLEDLKKEVFVEADKVKQNTVYIFRAEKRFKLDFNLKEVQDT